MIIYLAMTGTILAVLTFVMILVLHKLRLAVIENTLEVQELRLTARARIKRASVQSGAVTDEQRLIRLGRASTGRRIVVGGDDDSQLKKDLTTYEVPDEENNE